MILEILVNSHYYMYFILQNPQARIGIIEFESFKKYECADSMRLISSMYFIIKVMCDL